MTRKEFKDYLEAEVYKDEGVKRGFIRKIIHHFYTTHFLPSRRAVYMVRKMQYYYERGGKWALYAEYLHCRIGREFGCYISTSAKIAKGFHLPHPTGIVIGSASVLGENVAIYQGVTIGGGRIGDAKKGNQPKVGNNVVCFAGCKILGQVVVANDCIIAAGSIVLKDTEAGGVYAGIPAKKVK